MSWFGGFVLRGRKNNTRESNTRVPADALLLRDGNIGVWAALQGASGDVRVVSKGDRWIAVFGVCGAGGTDLLNFFTQVVKEKLIDGPDRILSHFAMVAV